MITLLGILLLGTAVWVLNVIKDMPLGATHFVGMFLFAGTLTGSIWCLFYGLSPLFSLIN